jgi:hypothetical protein
MECLLNFIGLSQSCSEIAPTSGIYLDDFQGITLKQMASTESGKWLSAQNALDNLVRIEANSCKERLREILGNVIIETAIESIFSKNFGEDYFPQQNGNPGWRAEKRPTKLSYMFMSNVRFKSHTAAIGLVITITDGVNPVTFTIDTEADEEYSLMVNYSTTQTKIDITYSSTAGPSDEGISPYKGSVPDYQRWGCNKCSNKGTDYIQIHGLDFDGVEKNEFYGIQADVELRCDMERMVCLIARHYPMMFATGVVERECREWAMSDRFNISTLASRDEAGQLAEFYKKEKIQMWFDNGPALTKLLQSAESACFTCTGIQFHQQVP